MRRGSEPSTKTQEARTPESATVAQAPPQTEEPVAPSLPKPPRPTPAPEPTVLKHAGRSRWPSRLAALAFAAAAPVGTFVLASEWGDVHSYMKPGFEDYRAVCDAQMLKAGSLALATALAVAISFVRLRGESLGSIEASLIWLGCALTLTMAVGLLFKKQEWLALGDGPDRYFFGGLPFGLALAAAAGVALYRRWHS